MTDNPNGRQKKQDRPRKTDRQTNALNGKERFALWTALKEAKGELEAERADMVKAAAMMTQRLGFKVTNHNIKDAINQGIVNWKRPHERSGVSTRAVAELKDQLDRMANVLTATITRFDALEQRLAAVEDIVLRLCAASGTGEKVEHESQAMRAPDAWVSK
jgi:acetolactate synthase regulatory subunit